MIILMLMSTTMMLLMMYNIRTRIATVMMVKIICMNTEIIIIVLCFGFIFVNK